MGWVEELKPDDEVEVEIIWPQAYVDYNMNSIKTYSAGISHLCKGAALLGDTETEFLVWDITILQTFTIEQAMRNFGVELTHDSGKLENGRRWVYFYADLRDLVEKMKSGEIE